MGRKSGGISFVIVLWLEPQQSTDAPQWRWRVTDVQSGNKAYFCRIADLLAYVSERAGVTPPA
ncbi:MAG: hypothetical protein ACK4K2_04210 [Dehalococcoidia bacterium]